MQVENGSVEALGSRILENVSRVLVGKEAEIELCAIALQRCDQHAGVHIALERHVVRRLPGEVLGERRFVVEDQ